ncbi:MAG TPA: signal recognition particle-docking protein FtsY [Candidatus Sulfotelmatobacter sp.]|nr:signal recognition particle-docking protein FtsY [Candidatus Sulfotelmatobacter sp.]
MGWLDRLKEGLRRTRETLVATGGEVLAAAAPPSSESLEELEEALVAVDFGPRTAAELVAKLQALPLGFKPRDMLRRHLQAVLQALDKPAAAPPAPPIVILFVGVNGTGKTTTIGKLAHRWIAAGEKVLLVAGDTFRAAAIDQLKVWGERVGAPVVAHQPGADPSAVVFDALRAARARGADRVLIDTAGRLHTKKNLMEELKKIHRVTARELPGAPHETLLVLDAVTGTNGLVQAKEFHAAVPLTGIILTKLDGTAKGGIAVAIARELALPVRYIGVGEALDDLQPFDPAAYLDALLP